jgi:hypothetical protein
VRIESIFNAKIARGYIAIAAGGVTMDATAFSFPIYAFRCILFGPIPIGLLRSAKEKDKQ